MDRNELRQLYERWEEADMEEQEAASRASYLEEMLQVEGLDPRAPPAWLFEDTR